MKEKQYDFDEVYEKMRQLNNEKAKQSADDSEDITDDMIGEWVESMSEREGDEALKLAQKVEKDREVSDNLEEESLVFDEAGEMKQGDAEDEAVETISESKEDISDEDATEETQEQDLVAQPVSKGRRDKSASNASEKKQKSRSKKQAEATMIVHESETDEAPVDKVKENIDYTRRFIDMTRRNRMNMSERLTRYSRRWKLVFFAINMEAVIFILLSLTGTIENVEIGAFSIPFSWLAGIFTIYVILLQYYINGLNYNERAFRAHYHQLELRDLGLHLNMLLIKRETAGIHMTDKDLIDKNEEIVEKYQLTLKNNESHREIDNKKRIRCERRRAYLNGTSKKRASLFPPLDFTLDNMLIITNAILAVITFVMMISVFLGVNLF